MATYICADCGKNVKRTHLKKLHHDDGTVKWVCLGCYATYPDPDDEEEKPPKPKGDGEKVELLRGKNMDKELMDEEEKKEENPEIINLKGRVKDAERIRDANYDLFTEVQRKNYILREMYRDDVVTYKLKYMALNEKYKVLRRYVNTKVIQRWKWFAMGYMAGSAIIATLISLINLVVT